MLALHRHHEAPTSTISSAGLFVRKPKAYLAGSVQRDILLYTIALIRIARVNVQDNKCKTESSSAAILLGIYIMSLSVTIVLALKGLKIEDPISLPLVYTMKPFIIIPFTYDYFRRNLQVNSSYKESS